MPHIWVLQLSCLYISSLYNALGLVWGCYIICVSKYRSSDCIVFYFMRSLWTLHPILPISCFVRHVIPLCHPKIWHLRIYKYSIEVCYHCNVLSYVTGKPEIEQKNIPVESENDVVAECCLQYSNHHYHPTFSWLIDNNTFPIRTSTPRYTYHHGIYTTCNAISFVSKRSYNSGTLECLIIGSGPVSARTKLNILCKCNSCQCTFEFIHLQ